MFGVIWVRLEIVPLDDNDPAARATGRLDELGTRGITLLPPATAAVASVVDETTSCLVTGGWLRLGVCCEVVVGMGCERQASSLVLVVPD